MMIPRKSGILRQAGNTVVLRRYLLAVVGLFSLLFLFAGTQADAQRVYFRSNGGRWSHTRHVGWHRYWGGPSVGYYYAPEPVYVVRGYDAPSYYSGPDYWYSNPSFGLSVNLGGGHYRRVHHGPYYHRYHR